MEILTDLVSTEGDSLGEMTETWMEMDVSLKTLLYYQSNLKQ